MMPEETQVPAQQPSAPDAGPLASSNLTATVIMVLIAIMGGIANFWQKLQSGKVRVFNVAEFVGEIFISGVAGLLAYWLFKGMGLNEYLTAAGVGIVGHMGSRAIFIAENWLEQRAKK